MNAPYRPWRIAAVIGLVIFVTGCILPAATTTPTATAQPALGPTATPGQLAGGGSAGPASGGNGSGSGGSGSGGAGSGSGGTSGDSTGSPTQPPAPSPSGPYAVKQIETLGGEVISGVVCSLIKPFSVTSVTPKVTFAFQFAPQNAQQGGVTYQYSISSAGESHDAAGTYTLNSVGADGTLQLSLSVSDHVVFKGFDGSIPNRYKFNLVPTSSAACPPAP